MVLLARKDEEGNTQALYDHLHGAGRLASGFEDEFADISRTAAVLHDVGKVAQQFQTYRMMGIGEMCSMPVKGRLSSMIFSSRKGKLKR